MMATHQPPLLIYLRQGLISSTPSEYDRHYFPTVEDLNINQQDT